MTTSAHGSAGPWGAEAWPVEDAPYDQRLDGIDEHDLLAQEAPAEAWGGYADVSDDWGPEETLPPEAGLWGDYDESAAEGLTGRALIMVTALAAGGCAALDLALTAGRMTFFFDLCFVVICLVGTMAVRRADLFTAGVLPPLMFAAVIAVVAVAAPHAFESAPGVNKVFLSGLASHAPGLVGGYAVALLAVAARMAASPGRDR
jgi:uncharacterized protein DUF6542